MVRISNDTVRGKKKWGWGRRENLPRGGDTSDCSMFCCYVAVLYLSTTVVRRVRWVSGVAVIMDETMIPFNVSI